MKRLGIANQQPQAPEPFGEFHMYKFHLTMLTEKASLTQVEMVQIFWIQFMFTINAVRMLYAKAKNLTKLVEKSSDKLIAFE